MRTFIYSIQKILSAVILFPVAAGFFASAQTTPDFNDYHSLRSSGVMPGVIDKIRTQREESEEKKDDRKKTAARAENNYRQASAYFVERLLLNGQVIFGDEITAYCNRVVDELLKDDPALRARVSVFHIRSSAVNAFATGEGVICVTTGMIAKLPSEAALAYVLAHEIAHIKEKHSLKEAVENSKRNTRGKNEEQIELESSMYSKEQELEADRIGWDLFRKTAYASEGVNEVLDILKFSETPVYETELSSTLFNYPGFILPADYFPPAIPKLAGEEDYENDEKSTHPNLGTRREELEPLLKKRSAGETQRFLLGEDQFELIVKIARYELCIQYLKDQEYARALYHAHTLMADNPESYFLKRTAAQALLGLTVYANSGRLSRVLPDEDDIQGEEYRIAFMLNNLEKNELNLLALHNAWTLYKAYPDKEQPRVLKDVLLEQLLKNHAGKTNVYSRTPKDTALKASETQFLSDAEKKYVARKEKRKGPKGDPLLAKYALVELFADEDFASQFKQTERKIQAARTEGVDRSELARIRKEGHDEKVVIVDPFYMLIDERKEVSLRFRASKERELKFEQYIQQASRRLDLKTEVIDISSIASGDPVDFYNDFAIIQQRLDEAEVNRGMPIPATDYEEVAGLQREYRTSYFAKLRVLSITQRPKARVGAIITGIFLWPMLPGAIYNSVRPRHYLSYEMAVYDIVKGDKCTYREDTQRKNSSEDYLKSVLYDVLYSIKHTSLQK